MNVFDLVIGGILAFFAFKGYRHGFLREIAGLIGIIIAFILAIRLMDDFSSILSHYLGLSPRVAVIVTAIVIFIVVLAAFVIAARFIRKLMDIATLGWIDRLAGSLFGLFKAVLITSSLTLIVSLLPLGKDFSKKQDNSLLFNPIRKAGPLVFNGVSKLLPAAGDFYSEIKQSLADRSGEINIDTLKWLNSFQKKKNELEQSIKSKEII